MEDIHSCSPAFQVEYRAGSVFTLRLCEDTYEDGNAALICEMNEDGYWEPFNTLSVNIPQVSDGLLPGEYFIKDYSENEDMVRKLVELRILMPALRAITNGYTRVPVMRYEPSNIPGAN